MCLISVLIPTFNHCNYITATLNSVFAQTFTDYEIIVVNDGSPDDTAQLLKPLSESGKIRYIEQENQGQSAARNRGLAEAQGQYIAFLDDDDLWPADKLQWQVEFLGNNPDHAAVGGSATMIDNDGNAFSHQTYPSHSIASSLLFRGNPFMSPGQVLIRADTLREIGGLDTHLQGTDDYNLWFEMAHRAKFAYVSRDALLYRLHDSNASRDVTGMLANFFKVHEIHIHKVPRRMRKLHLRYGYRCAYRYFGERIIDGLRESLKERNLRKIARFGKMIFVFIRASLSDPRLCRWLIRDLLLSDAISWVGKLEKEQPT